MKNIGIYSLSPADYLLGNKLDPLLYLYDKLFIKENLKIDLLLPIIQKLGYEKEYYAKLKEIENLEKYGFIEILDEKKTPKVNNDLIQRMLNKAYEISYEVAYNNKESGIKYFFDLIESQEKVQDLNSRCYSMKLNTVNKNIYIPILKEPHNQFLDEHTVKNSAVYSILTNKIPTPTDFNYLQLSELKSDPDFKLKSYRLRNWINEVSKENLSTKEIEQKLEYLLEEYTQQFLLHKMKYTLSSFESFITLTADTIENLARLKFGAVAKTIFDIQKSDIAFLEAETNFAGREVALIHKIKNLS
ncbi:hypothetical protein [Flavobacterium sp. AG291]|uniref:hypothetical protein n=1 Tax=Flavobacterium sp. AG291 TaxID=2184000 RepID=UPI000E0C7AD0|nr:hypothetical protein [Flavobacterium sp. AG291]RDI15893.1 hypothetical protein DEU42_101186 [Flavobacterium sp. AG291]